MEKQQNYRRETAFFTERRQRLTQIIVTTCQLSQKIIRRTKATRAVTQQLLDESRELRSESRFCK